MRYYLVVIDSFGIGADSVCGEYGDCGSNTALSASRAIEGEKWRFLVRMGLGNSCKTLGVELEGCEEVDNPIANYAVLEKRGGGKDTQTGHWELAGMNHEFTLNIFPPEYPSFPEELVKRLEKETGRKVIGNKSVSGTKIIKELGKEHMETGSIICYTSADSVFQIAAHEEVVPLEELYDICEKARRICDDYKVGRVIARPFVGNEKDGFVRTKNRKDYSIELPNKTLMEDKLHSLDVSVVAVGKIWDIFDGKGIDVNYPDKGNEACLDRVEKIARTRTDKKEFVFVNLVDTDMLYGHRRDPLGYCNEVERVSRRLEEIFYLLDDGDMLCLTADHGCDPGFKGTDHTREYVPFLECSKRENKGEYLGLVNGFDFAIKRAIKYFG